MARPGWAAARRPRRTHDGPAVHLVDPRPAPASPRRVRRARSSRPTDDTYDDARRLWNAVHDRRPAVIVRPTIVADVATAIRFAREHDLEIAVRSGGHSAAGSLDAATAASSIDLSRMRGVTVDPATRIARANGGALLGELDVAAQAHGLVCPIGVIGHTGRRRADARRRGRPAAAALRADDRQPARRRARDRGRPARPRERDRGARALLGHARRRLELRDRDGVRVRAPPVRARCSTAACAIYPATAGPRGLGSLRDYAADGAGRRLDDLRDRAAPRRPRRPASAAGRRADRRRRRTTTAARRRRSSATRPGCGAARSRSRVTGGSQPVPRGPDRARPRHRLGPSLVHQGPVRERRPARGARRARRPRGAPGRPADRSRSPPRAARSRGSRRTRWRIAGRAARFDLSADSAGTTPPTTRPTATGSAGRWRSSSRTRSTGRYANENADAGPDETAPIYGDAKLARLAALKRTWDPDNVFRLNHNVAPAPS